jgi:DDE superfamily endonuclease
MPVSFVVLAYPYCKGLSILTRIHTYFTSPDETHFVINVDNGRTLGLSRDKSVRYQGVVSGGQAMTRMVRISGGKGAIVWQPLLVFQNVSRSYPMKGVPDDVPGVAYRTQPKGWVDGKVFAEYLNESRMFKRDRRGRKRVLYVDNCTNHVLTDAVEAALTRLNIEIRKLPPNSTHLTQPCDGFVIPKIKT